MHYEYKLCHDGRQTVTQSMSCHPYLAKNITYPNENIQHILDLLTNVIIKDSYFYLWGASAIGKLPE